MHYIPPSCTSSPCNPLFLNLGIKLFSHMAHVVDGKLYFKRDYMQGNLIPKNLKLPEPKTSP